jgi:hypothetical protein
MNDTPPPAAPAYAPSGNDFAKLERSRAKLRDTAAALVKERDEARKEAEKLAKDLEAAKASDAKVAELQQQLRDRDHRDAFAKLAKERGATDATVDSIWKLTMYEAKGEKPDEALIAKALDEAAVNPAMAPLFSGGQPVFRNQVPGSSNGKGPDIPAGHRPGVNSGQGGRTAGPSEYTITDDDPRASDVAYQMRNWPHIQAAAMQRMERGEI